MARKKAEAQEPEEGSWASLKKTIIAALTTLIAGGGTWLGVQLFNGGGDEAEEAKTEQVAPAATAAPITINVEQNQENKQKTENNNAGGPTIIREKVIEKAAPEAAPKPKKEEEDSW